MATTTSPEDLRLCGVADRIECCLIVLLCALAALCGGRPIADGDVLWQLHSGLYMLEHYALLPHPDPFVYNAAGPGVQHGWLAQAVMAVVVRWGGLEGLRLLGASLAFVATGLVYLALRRRQPLAALALTALWWMLVEPHSGVRPHVQGWVLAVAVLGLALPARRYGLAVVLTVLWANLHASALLAPAYSLVATVEGRLRRRSESQVLPGWLPIALVAAVCLQPNGPTLFWYALGTPAINTAMSYEWWPLLSVETLRSRPETLVIWVLLAALAVRSGWRKPGDAPFPLSGVGLLALVHAALTRRMTAFLFLSAMALPPVRARARLLGVLALLGVVALHGPTALATLGTPGALAAGAFPERAATVLAGVQPVGRLFNPDGWGGYLGLAARKKVFADGRFPLVGRRVVEDGLAMQVRQGGSGELFERYEIALAVFELRSYLRVPPPDPSQWVLVWQDPVALVLLRRGPAFAGNTRRFCRFYDQNPSLGAHGRWSLRALGPAGRPTPTDVPTVMDFCGLDPGQKAVDSDDGSVHR